MSVAVVIPTLDPDTAMIRTCTQAILATTDAEIIVSHDEHREGFAATCNRGAKETTADVLVFLNDDTIPQPGWLTPLTDQLTDNEIRGAHLLYPDGSTQHSGIFLRRRGPLLEPYNRLRPAPTQEVPAVTGACLAVTRAAWDDLGGFDEGYRNGYEDVDLCLRHREAGGTVRYVAESTVVHLESVSEGRFDHAAHNIDLLQQRWGHLPITR